MKRTEREKIKVIMESDPASFEEAVNSALESFKDNSPRLDTFVFPETFKAIIHYYKTEEKAQTFTERANQAGVYYSCGECPYFEAGDGRWGSCPLSMYGKVMADENACEWFYKKMANGERIVKKEVIRR